MRYEGSVYRPPSEADSLIIQVTIGCSHNECTFCSMYKDKRFRARAEEEIFKDLEMAREIYPYADKFFLADGNALVLSTEKLLRIFEKIKKLFPDFKRIGIYASPKDILTKTDDELKLLKENGLYILYLGVESGSDIVLGMIKKGVNSLEMIEAGKKAVNSGLKLSAMIISGLGGKDYWREHAIESARVLSEINPHYIGLLTLLIDDETEIAKEIKSGLFKLLGPIDILKETHLFIENLNVINSVFRSNHASNYVSLRGNIPEDQKRILGQLERALECSEEQLQNKYRQL